MIADQHATLRNGLKEYEEVLAAHPDGDAGGLESEEESAVILYGTTHAILVDTAYGEGTLLDFFMQSPNSLSVEDYMPIAAALTPGQVELLSTVGVNQMIQASAVAGEDASAGAELVEATADAALEEAGVEHVSVYAGVDRSVFNGSTALTNDALRRQAKTGDASWAWGNGDLSAFGILLTLAIGSAVVATACWIERGISAVRSARALSDYNKVLAVKINRANFADTLEYLSEREAKEKAVNAYASEKAKATISAGIATGVLMLATAAYFGYQLYEYYHPDYKEIPRNMVDEVVDDDGNTSYAVYHVVCGLSGDAADANAFSGKQWNAVYVSTDAKAGKPVTASSLRAQTGAGDAGAAWSGVHLFGETAAFNLNSHAYKDGANGVYLFFQRDAGTLAGSGFSYGFAAVAAMVGIVVGIAGTALSIVARRRRSGSLTPLDA